MAGFDVFLIGTVKKMEEARISVFFNSIFIDFLRLQTKDVKGLEVKGGLKERKQYKWGRTRNYTTGENYFHLFSQISGHVNLLILTPHALWKFLSMQSTSP